MSNEVKQKARAELLDELTGKPISEVDILTSSETIFYTNSDPLLEDVGNLKVGQKFDKYRLDKILDNLLYKYTKPTISVLSTNNTDFPDIVTESNIVLKPKNANVKEFSITGTFVAGTQKNITASLKVYYPDSTVYTDTNQLTVDPSKTYVATFTVPAITKSATIVFSVFDGIEMVEAPRLIYKFVDPVFVGFADPKLLDDNLELDITRISEYYDYFINLIKSDSNLIKAEYLDIPAEPTDVRAMATDITGETVVFNPFILVPATWGDVSSITDMNGFQILKMYTILTGFNLKLYDDSTTVSYILCMSKTSVDTNSKFVEGIKYRFQDIVPDISNVGGNGVPIMSSFTLNAQLPVDDRFTVRTYEDLLAIKFPYNGLITFVEDINTYFSYKNNNWLPTSTKVVLIEDNSILTATFCGWDDVAINASTGQVFRKRYNNVWELWGVLGDALNRSMQWKGTYSSIAGYKQNDVVYYNNTTYVCKANTNIIGETPSDTSSNWDIMCKGYNGSDIRYVDKDTGEIL